jgi:hypothetical protein
MFPEGEPFERSFFGPREIVRNGLQSLLITGLKGLCENSSLLGSISSAPSALIAFKIPDPRPYGRGY